MLKREILPSTDKERRDLRKWQKIDKSVTNADTLPEFVESTHEVGKHALVQDNMLRGVIYNFAKKLWKGSDVDNPSSKVNCELIKLFRTKFYDNMKMFPFSLKDNKILTPFPIHSVILFAIQIQSLYENVSYISRDKLLYSLARIFTGCSSHREDNDQSTEHTAGKLPHNHIFFELVVVACGSMIDTFCQLGYLTISEHKTGAMEIRVHSEYRDVSGLMIIPTP
jgi:hypothetical protein